MAGIVAGLMVTGAAFAFAGSCALYAARRVSDRSRHPSGFGRGCLALWWGGIGAAAWLRGLEILLATTGYRDVDVFWTLRALGVLVASAAFGALATHAALLLTGTRRSVPLGVLVGACLQVALTYLLVQGAEPSVWLGRWGAGVMDETDRDYRSFLLVASLPAMVVAGAYASVAARVRDPRRSRRLALVASALVVAFGGLLAAQALLPEDGLVHGILKTGGLAAGGLAVLGAYARRKTPLRRAFPQ